MKNKLTKEKRHGNKTSNKQIKREWGINDSFETRVANTFDFSIVFFTYLDVWLRHDSSSAKILLIYVQKGASQKLEGLKMSTRTNIEMGTVTNSPLNRMIWKIFERTLVIVLSFII